MGSRRSSIRLRLSRGRHMVTGLRSRVSAAGRPGEAAQVVRSSGKRRGWRSLRARRELTFSQKRGRTQPREGLAEATSKVRSATGQGRDEAMQLSLPGGTGYAHTFAGAPRTCAQPQPCSCARERMRTRAPPLMHRAPPARTPPTLWACTPPRGQTTCEHTCRHLQATRIHTCSHRRAHIGTRLHTHVHAQGNTNARVHTHIFQLQARLTYFLARK